MVAQPVEAVWVWLYNLSAQKATYGRFTEDTSFTKDYLQASGDNAALLDRIYPRPTGAMQSDIAYKWVGGQATGFLRSPNDRQHVSWSTTVGAPPPWRLTLVPTPSGPGTIPGDPRATTASGANAALATYAGLGITSYLVGVKLAGEPGILHIRAYVNHPPASLSFADASLLPPAVLTLMRGLTASRGCRSALFGAGTPSGAAYFDPDVNHAAWSTVPPVGGAPGVALPAPAPLSPHSPVGGAANPPEVADVNLPVTADAAAELAPFDDELTDQYSTKIASGDFSVPDAYGSSKTRGSAQRAFARAVKANYGWQCAVTGITTRAFLVASHIVPWADDASIRTDPSNGICLSTLVDRAFDAGYLTIEVDRVVRVQADKLAGDPALQAALLPYDGQPLRVPKKGAPSADYLARRLGLV